MYAKVSKRKWTTSKGEERQAWIVDYKDQNGDRHIKTFAKKGLADDFLTTVRGEVRDKKHVAPSKSITVAAAGKEWIAAVKQGRNIHGDHVGPAEASTIRQYEYLLRHYVEPELGKVLLANLSKEDVKTFRTNLLAKVSRSLARKALGALKGILSEAVDSDRLTVNVAAAVKIGTGGRHKEEVTIPAVADIRKIRDKLAELAAQHEHWIWRRAFIETAIHTGFRASELRGLPWDAVDLKAGTIKVVQRADENCVVGSPKSKSGHRTVSIPASLMTILREWKLRAGAGPLVFATAEGKPHSLANITKRTWKPLQVAAGIRQHYNFHSLRHLHASMLISSGTDLKEVQVEMGHASIQITLDTYGHLIEGGDAEQRRKERAEKLAGMLG